LVFIGTLSDREILHTVINVPPHPINYSQIRMLDWLTLHGAVFDDFANAPGNLLHPVFLNMFNILPHAPPSQLDLQVTVQGEYSGPLNSSHRAFDNIYSRIYHPSLIQYLVRSKRDFPATRVSILIDIEMYKSFASLDEIDLARFEIILSLA